MDIGSVLVICRDLDEGEIKGTVFFTDLAKLCGHPRVTAVKDSPVRYGRNNILLSFRFTLRGEKRSEPIISLLNQPGITHGLRFIKAR